MCVYTMCATAAAMCESLPLSVQSYDCACTVRVCVCVSVHVCVCLLALSACLLLWEQAQCGQTPSARLAALPGLSPPYFHRLPCVLEVGECMCVCVCACVCACMHGRVSESLCKCVCYMCMRVCLCLCLHVFVHV